MENNIMLQGEVTDMTMLIYHKSREMRTLKTSYQRERLRRQIVKGALSI